MKHQEPRSKRRSAVLAGLLVLMMLLTGTWAWQNFNQRAFNPAYGSSNFGGRLHNDYNGENTGTHNQDIYAENFGYNDLFVRVQLREYLALGGTPIGDAEGINISDPSTWPIYNSAADDVTTRRPDIDAALIGKEGISLDFGGSKVFMPSFNQATHLVENIDPSVPDLYKHETAYNMTNATGRGIDAIASALDIVNPEVTHVSDMSNMGFQTGPGTTDGGPSVGNGGHYDWNLDQTFLAPVLRVNDEGILTLEGPYEHTAQSTLLPTRVNNNGVDVTNGVMTLTQWQEADRPTGNFWVLDTENDDEGGGWFYWASPLPPGQATSLLVDQLTINEHIEDWEYVITPTADFVTRGDMDTLDNFSDDARELWERASIRLDLTVHYIDVGQGDAIFIQTPDNENILIDAGTTAGGRAVVAYLQQLGVETIDYVIATHPHADHIQGFPQVFENFEIKSVYAPRVSHTTVAFRNFLSAVENAGLNINTVTAGLELPTTRIDAVFVGPVRDYAASALNDWSAVLHITHSDNTFIFTGDAERAAEMDMVTEYGDALQADVLKVSHHGSNTSTIQEFLDVAQPSIAIIQVGPNSYGHPNQQVLNRLTNAGATVYRNDLNGTVIVASNGSELSVQMER